MLRDCRDRDSRAHRGRPRCPAVMKEKTPSRTTVVWNLSFLGCGRAGERFLPTWLGGCKDALLPHGLTQNWNREAPNHFCHECLNVTEMFSSCTGIAWIVRRHFCHGSPRKAASVTRHPAQRTFGEDGPFKKMFRKGLQPQTIHLPPSM